MKRVKCPKCEAYITFDETQYTDGQQLVFECTTCHKQFGIRIRKSHAEEQAPTEDYGSLVVVENVFHYKQVIALTMGDNVVGRHVIGANINCPIETADPSIDTRHCIIRLQRNRRGALEYILRDAPSGTGTFYMNQILRDQDRVRLADGDIITIGATTLILRTAPRRTAEII